MDFMVAWLCVAMRTGNVHAPCGGQKLIRERPRWGTIPVVKAAQTEKVIDFPPELEAPWAYLQRNFGVTAESGNNTANVLLNFNERAERVYKINVGMSDLIRSSEEVFFRMFYDVEVLVRIIPIEIFRIILKL